jgi:hypothetical protein
VAVALDEPGAVVPVGKAGDGLAQLVDSAQPLDGPAGSPAGGQQARLDGASLLPVYGQQFSNCSQGPGLVARARNIYFREPE